MEVSWSSPTSSRCFCGCRWGAFPLNLHESHTEYERAPAPAARVLLVDDDDDAQLLVGSKRRAPSQPGTPTLDSDDDAPLILTSSQKRPPQPLPSPPQQLPPQHHQRLHEVEEVTPIVLIKNKGNSCYAAAALQLFLASCSVVRQAFDAGVSPERLPAMRSPESLEAALAGLLSNPPTANLLTLTAADPSKNPWSFRACTQQDPTEFMSHLLKALGETATRWRRFIHLECVQKFTCPWCGSDAYRDDAPGLAFRIAHPDIGQPGMGSMATVPPIRVSETLQRQIFAPNMLVPSDFGPAKCQACGRVGRTCSLMISDIDGAPPPVLFVECGRTFTTTDNASLWDSYRGYPVICDDIEIPRAGGRVKYTLAAFTEYYWLNQPTLAHHVCVVKRGGVWTVFDDGAAPRRAECQDPSAVQSSRPHLLRYELVRELATTPSAEEKK